MSTKRFHYSPDHQVVLLRDNYSPLFAACAISALQNELKGCAERLTLPCEDLEKTVMDIHDIVRTLKQLQDFIHGDNGYVTYEVIRLTLQFMILNGCDSTELILYVTGLFYKEPICHKGF